MPRRSLLLVLIVLILAIVGLFFLRGGSFSPTSEIPQATITTIPTDKLEGTYKGNLPCADCSGIEETLTLTQPDASVMGGTYTLNDVYVGKDTNFETTGTWTTQEGTTKNPEAIVIILRPSEKNSQSAYYGLTPEGNLTQLDQNQNEIEAEGMNFTLTKTSSQ